MTSLRRFSLFFPLACIVAAGCGASARSAREPNDEITVRAPDPDDGADATSAVAAPDTRSTARPQPRPR